jgi:hypothetical protein
MKNNAYRDTEVHWTKSQHKIIEMLNKRGIFDTRFTNLKDKFVLEFVAKTDEISKPVAIRMIVPINEQGIDERKRQKDLNFLHRVLFHRLKEKFVGIDNGLIELTKEFMPDLIITDKAGNTTTLGQALLPQYKNSIESGEQKEFKLLN